MAMIHDTPEDFRPTDQRCLCCGVQGVAFWMGYGEAVVCAKCATTKLPLLIADAVLAEGEPSDIDAALNTVIKSFLRGTTIALGRRSQGPNALRFAPEDE